ANIAKLWTEGMEAFAETYSVLPIRLPYRRKDPRGWAEFRHQLGEHSAIGSAHTQAAVQLGRPTIFALEAELRRLPVPARVLVGDEDTPCVEPAIFMKRTIPSAGRVVSPQSRHTINREEPDRFNAAVLDFLHTVE